MRLVVRKRNCKITVGQDILGRRTHAPGEGPG